MADATLTKAEIVIKIRDEARKILQQLGADGVKALTELQKKVDELDGRWKEQAKTIKALEKAIEDQGAAAKKAGEQSADAGKTATTAAQGATLATKGWAFAVSALERVWKGLKSALIIAPLLAITQQLLSALTDAVKGAIGFGEASEGAARKVQTLADAQKAFADQLERSEAFQRRQIRGGDDAVDVLKKRIALLEAERDRLLDSPSPFVNAESERNLLGKLGVQTSGIPASLQENADGKVFSSFRSADVAARVQDNIDYWKQEQASVEAAAKAYEDLVAAQRKARDSARATARERIIDEAAFANAPLPANLAAFTRNFHANAGLPSNASAINSAGGPAALAGLSSSTLQTTQADTASSFGLLTRALGDQRVEMSALAREAQLLTVTLAAQSAEEKRAATAAGQKLSLMAQAATTDEERIAVINLQIDAERQLLQQQLDAGQLVKAEYEEQVALLEVIRGKKVGTVGGGGGSGASGFSTEANVGINALATAFSDVTTNAQNAAGAAEQFFASVAKGLADVASQEAAKSLFSFFIGSASGASGGGGATGTAAAKGAIFGGHFQAFANGGIASSPTLGLIAEAGQNEAIVPLPDNRSIPVIFPGGGGSGGVTINVTSTVQAIDRADFDAHLDRHGKRIAEIVADKMATHRGLRHSTRETVRGGR